MDNKTDEQRSRNMSLIRSGDTTPELILRSQLHRAGLRFRVRNKVLGKPDLIFPVQRIAVFVDGCFWHGCPTCYQKPKSNPKFWEEKLENNIQRDRYVSASLAREGWLVLRYWEHEIRENIQQVTADIVGYYRSRKGQ